MAQRENLLTVKTTIDDETGMYEIGAIDFSVSGSLRTYLEEYGNDGVKEILATLGHLAWEVKEEYHSIQKKERLDKSHTNHTQEI